MIVRVVKTRKVTAKACTLEELLDESLTELTEGSVVAIAAKVVSMCEGRVVPIEGNDREKLVAREAQRYLPGTFNRYNLAFAINRGLLVANAGIDESNADGQYVLWPSDPQASANQARAFLRQKFGLKKVGVILTDSAIRPLVWGTTGIALAHSGFEPLRDYVGEADLFGRQLEYHKNNIKDGLAAAAALVAGEGSEQTPLVVLEELDFVRFVDRDPSREELEHLLIDPEADMFSVFLKQAPWRDGQAGR